MKIVSYVVKEDVLNIQSLHAESARLGWCLHDWVIDIGFTQQWFVYFRSWLPRQMKWLSHDFIQLIELFELIKKEDFPHLQIQGEPVALPITEVHLFPPLQDTHKLFYPMIRQSPHVSSHPQRIVGTEYLIDRQRFYPGIACMVGEENTPERLIGCCLINYWCDEQRLPIPSMGSFLVTPDEWESDSPLELNILQNGQLIDQQPIDLEMMFAQYAKKREPGEMICLHVHQSPFFAQVGDEVEIKVEHLGRLQNRVDKI